MPESTDAFTNRRILVVEDEYLLATDLAQALEELGATVLGPVGSVEHALSLIAEEHTIDAAVLDINLGSEKVYPVAQALQERSVPFVFATGYANWVIPSGYSTTPRFEKPVDTRALARILSG
jgi:CheY-like chemotaxis protein